MLPVVLVLETGVRVNSNQIIIFIYPYIALG